MSRSIPMPGETLAGKFLVEHLLGRGGMGVVVAAKHLQLDQRVAIKWLLPEALGNADLVKRFAREARAAARIRGEHVARVIDVGTFDDGAPFMVMEYLEGEDLAKRLADGGPLPVEDVVRYLLETCEALAEAHSAKIVHRDLKPSNLFLTVRPDDRSIIKVLDFGISKLVDSTTMALTSPTAIVGTAYYMSPEQMSAPLTVDHRSDIWSLGVVAYELLAGTPPFNGRSVPEVIAAILKNDPPALDVVRPTVPAGLAAVVARCLRTNPAARFQDVAELAHALAPFAAVDDRSSSDTTARVLGKARGTTAPPPVFTTADREAVTADGVVATPAVPEAARRSRALLLVGVPAVALGAVAAIWFLVASPYFASHRAPEPRASVVVSASAPAAPVVALSETAPLPAPVVAASEPTPIASAPPHPLPAVVRLPPAAPKNLPPAPPAPAATPEEPKNPLKTMAPK